MAGTWKVHLSSIVLIVLLFLSGISAGQKQILTYVSEFGFLALLTILLIIASPIMYKLKPGKFTAFVLANRRWIGIYSFVFAFIHIVIVFNFLFSWDITAAMSNTYRLLGGIAFLILAALTATSNNTSVRKLGRNWKRLHYFVYPALILIVIHSTGIGEVFMNEAVIKTIIILVTAVLIIWKLYLYKKRRSTQKNIQQQNAQTQT
ncbi:ferric reductase-like transmembrane domain-containing protein [archaeon]|nr:ferric reductase-like transmembrane domain-containing protein [archaeon]